MIKYNIKTRTKLLVLFIIIFELSFVSNTCIAQWIQTSNPNGGTVNTLVASGYNLFAGTHAGGIFKTTNDGNNWTTNNIGLSNLNVVSLAIIGLNIFAGTYGGGIFLSTNNGYGWIEVNNGLSNMYVNAIIASGANIYAGTNIGVFMTSNNGASWSLLNNGLTNLSVLSFAITETCIYAGTFSSGIFLSTNNGDSWVAMNEGLTNTFVYSLAVSGANIFAGTYGGGVFMSSNNGSNWFNINMGMTNKYVMALVVSGSNLFAGTLNGIFLSTNNGTNWIQKNQGINPVQAFYCFSIKDNFIFTGAQYGSIWRRSLTEIIGIQNISTEMSSTYSLSQNYPNPFNPTTTIKFVLARKGKASIIILDMLGKEIAKLVNEFLNAGTYTVDWNASDFPSGVYFCRLQTEDYKETKRIVLVK